MDAAGNIYIADTGNARIRKVTPGGLITTVAGTTPGYFGDNLAATSAQLSFPSKAVVAPNGDIYIADSANGRIRRVTTSGIITTVAGTGVPGFLGEGTPATSAQFSYPRDLAVDQNGAILVLDTNNARLRKFTPGGSIATVAGSGVLGFYGDQGAATLAQLALPWGVSVDRSGSIYLADTYNNRIRKIATDGTITTVVGLNDPGFTGDGGQAIFARLNRPTGAVSDGSGNLYIADTGNNRIRKVDARGIITTIAGGANGFSGDNGPATAAQLSLPESLAIDAGGNIYIADTGNNRIRKVSPQGIISTVAGSDTGAGDNGPAVNALLFQPSGLAFDSSGNLYIADTMNNRIRRVSPDGNIITVAGSGSAGYSGDNGFAVRAQLNHPEGLFVDRAGNLYIADTGNHTIRRVAGSLITTVAGNGAAGNSGDGGPATAAMLFGPAAVAVDRNGNLFVADTGNNRIRIVDPTGKIDAYAGDPTGLPGSSGDNGPARSATLDTPRGLALDSAGVLYVSDYFNNRIRRIVPGTNVISNYAGTGVGSFGGDGGPAVQAQLHLPAGIVFDQNQNLYIADLLNNRIRVVGANGIIQTVAGSGNFGSDGDQGPAVNALLASPRDLAIDAQGNIYLSDQDNNAVRRLVPGTSSIRTVVNAASLNAGFVAPGEAISIFGAQLGPAAGASGSPVNGAFSTTLVGTSVLFDNTPAPLLYVGVGQINAIVPYDVAGKSTVRLQVQVQGKQAAEFTLAVRDAAPGLFTSTSSGQGQAAAVNENGGINSVANPATPGSVIALFATGEGQTNPAGTAGRVVTGDATSLPKPLGSVTVLVQGSPAEVLFAGEAPFSAGLMQVNVRIPANILPGDRVPVELMVGNTAAQPSVTIAVR